MTPVAASLDGQDAFGFVVGMCAIKEAMAMARELGIGIVSVAPQHAFRHGGVLCDAGDRGGLHRAGVLQRLARDAALGRHATGCSAPIRSRPARRAASCAPFLLDMSPAVAARGKIRRAERRGESIPLGYALDAEGRPTTDPKAALGGVVLPIGGYKGSGLSMLMDILGGVISGAAFAGSVADQYKVYDRPQDVGHFFLAMRPDLFIPEEDYRARMDTLVERVRDCPKAEGFDEILIPGEPETRLEAEHRRTGIPYSPGRDRGPAGRGGEGRRCAAPGVRRVPLGLISDKAPAGRRRRAVIGCP